MPSKIWAVGEEVLAADFNDYVQEQVVATFPNAAARTAAIPSPAAGMVTFLGDTGRVEVFRAGQWVNLSGGLVRSFHGAIPDTVRATPGLYNIVQVETGVTFPMPVLAVADVSLFLGFGGGALNFQADMVRLDTTVTIASAPGGPGGTVPIQSVAGGMASAGMAANWLVAAGANAGLLVRGTYSGGSGDLHSGGNISLRYFAQ